MRASFLLSLCLLSLCFCENQSYLRRLSEAYNPSDFTSAPCGSFQTSCVEKKQEKHIIVGKEGEYPSKLIVEYTRFSTEQCESAALVYTISSSGPLSNHKVEAVDTFSADINIEKRTITFSQQPSVAGVTCDLEVELNKEYNTADLPCTLNGADLYADCMSVGSYNRVFDLSSNLEYDHNNSTQIDVKDRREQCEYLGNDNDDALTTEMWIWIGVLVVAAIIGIIVINFCVEKNSKKKGTEKSEEESDYSDEDEDEDEEKGEKKPTEKKPAEEKKEEKPAEEKKEEKPAEEKKEEKPAEEKKEEKAAEEKKEEKPAEEKKE